MECSNADENSTLSDFVILQILECTKSFFGKIKFGIISNVANKLRSSFAKQQDKGHREKNNKKNIITESSVTRV